MELNSHSNQVVDVQPITVMHGGQSKSIAVSQEPTSAVDGCWLLYACAMTVGRQRPNNTPKSISPVIVLYVSLASSKVSDKVILSG